MSMSVNDRLAKAGKIIEALGTAYKIVVKDYYVSDKWLEIFKKHKNDMMEGIFEQGEEELEMMMEKDYDGLASNDLNVVEDILWCINTIGTKDVTIPYKEFELNPFNELYTYEFHDEDFEKVGGKNVEDVLLFEENKGPHKVSFFCLDGPKQVKSHCVQGHVWIEEI
jgi:hypothetical protein